LILLRRVILLRRASIAWLLAATVAAGVRGAAVEVMAQPVQDQKQVLVLYSVRRDAQLVIVGERELTRILKKGISGGIDYYSEFIDQGRFDQPDYVAALRDFLRSKYKAKTFDVVIAVGDVPLEFVGRYPDEEMFRGPVVFFSTRRSSRPANSTGLIAEPNLRDTVSLAAELQPDVRNVFVISGASAQDLAFEALARRQLAPIAPRLAFTYLSGLPTRELEQRIASLPPHSIVYFLVVQRDPSGESFLPLEYLDRVTAVANSPVYSWVDSALDHGIVGGSLKDQVGQMRAVADLAVRVLHGEAAESIPTASPDLNVRQVDWRQLRRWRINEARVPAGTLVRFREPSAWERYHNYILGTIALLLAQSVLIAGLLVERARRRKAEEQATRSRSALRLSFSRIRDLGGRLLKAQETERARLARELHDDISQQIALLTIDLELLKSAAPEEAETLTEEALTRAHQMAGSVHDLSHRLHPAKLRLIGLVPALQSMQREMSRGEIPVTFTHENVPASLPPDLALCLFRIVQEGLQNAVKYSKANEISVRLCGGSSGLTLTIGDDGVGFDVNGAWGRGLGLISMQERLEPHGAAIEILSAPGAGTKLEVTVPWVVPDSPVTLSVQEDHVHARN
jgi:signal transduction histidine kinase